MKQSFMRLFRIQKQFNSLSFFSSFLPPSTFLFLSLSLPIIVSNVIAFKSPLLFLRQKTVEQFNESVSIMPWIINFEVFEDIFYQSTWAFFLLLLPTVDYFTRLFLWQDWVIKIYFFFSPHRVLLQFRQQIDPLAIVLKLTSCTHK